MRGDPDVIAGDWAAFSAKGGEDETVTVSRIEGDRKKVDVRHAKEIFKIPSIRFEAGAVAKSEQQFAGNDRGEENLISAADSIGNDLMSAEQRAIDVRIQQQLHFQSDSSTASQAAMLSRKLSSSA